MKKDRLIATDVVKTGPNFDHKVFLFPANLITAFDFFKEHSSYNIEILPENTNLLELLPTLIEKNAILIVTKKHMVRENPQFPIICLPDVNLKFKLEAVK